MELSAEEMTNLLDQAALGSEEAAQKLTERYGPYLRMAVRRWLHHRLRSQFDSLDFVQDVWASFFARACDKAAFACPAQLIAFLQSMARNKVVSAFRQRLQAQKSDLNREQSLQELQDRKGQHLPGREPTPSQVAICREEWQQLVEKQRPTYRAILRGCQEGKDVAAISREVGVSEKTVRRVLKLVKNSTSS
jgi:RNA polymerase sigma-70 factor (ECF subfamily)